MDVEDGGFYTFEFVSRNAIRRLCRRVHSLKANRGQKLELHITGTEGFGKSHALAALTVIAIRGGVRVVYLPDAEKCARSPFPYVMDALFLGYANDENMLRELCDCYDEKDIADFVARQQKGEILFIIDKINALEPSAVTNVEDGVESHRRATTRTWLLEMANRHNSILASSANHQAALASFENDQDGALENWHMAGGFNQVRIPVMFFSSKFSTLL